MLIEEIIEERDNIIDASLDGEKVNFSRLRKLCQKFNERDEEVFNIDGTDSDLWKSVSTYFRYLLRNS